MDVGGIEQKGVVASIAEGMAGVPAWLSQASPVTRAVVSFLAGALSVLSMPPFFLSPVLFLTLPLLVWLIDTAATGDAASTPRFDRDALARAGIAGWFFGFGYFVFGLFWIGEAFLVEAEKFAWLLPAAVTLLPAGLAIFFALAAIVARYFWLPGYSRILLLAVVIAIAEWLRGHVLTGLPWNTLGYALTAPLVLMQSAGLVGIYGLTIGVVVIFAGPLVTLANAGLARDTSSLSTTPARSFSALSGAIVAVLLVAGLIGYGQARLLGGSSETVPGVKLRIVQPSVAQRDKWRPDKQREIFDLHLSLSRRSPNGAVDNLAGITHLVWPEAAMPFLPLETPQALREIGDLLPDNVFLLTGALRVDRPDGQDAAGRVPRTDSKDGSNDGETSPAALRRAVAYNSFMAFGPSGGLAAVYDKIHLVPFGEYLPLQSTLEAIGLEQLTRIRGGFAAGRTPRPIMDLPGLPPVLGLICYEAIFPGAVVQGKVRPGVIINVTNDGWFGNTTGPRQHLHKARVRAVEEGVPVVRAANNGISAVIDSRGRIVQSLGMDIQGVIDAALPAASAPPLYAMFGDELFGALCVMLIGLMVYRTKNVLFKNFE